MSLTDSDADEIFPTDLVVQPSHLYAEPLNVAGIVNTEGESDEPLFRMTIIRFTKFNSTSIGVCHSHMLCAFPLDLHSSPHRINENDFSRWSRWHNVLQATVPTIPGPRA